MSSWPKKQSSISSCCCTFASVCCMWSMLLFLAFFFVSEEWKFRKFYYCCWTFPLFLTVGRVHTLLVRWVQPTSNYVSSTRWRVKINLSQLTFDTTDSTVTHEKSLQNIRLDEENFCVIRLPPISSTFSTFFPLFLISTSSSSIDLAEIQFAMTLSL